MQSDHVAQATRGKRLASTRPWVIVLVVSAVLLLGVLAIRAHYAMRHEVVWVASPMGQLPTDRATGQGVALHVYIWTCLKHPRLLFIPPVEEVERASEWMLVVFGLGLMSALCAATSALVLVGRQTASYIRLGVKPEFHRVALRRRTRVIALTTIMIYGLSGLTCLVLMVPASPGLRRMLSAPLILFLAAPFLWMRLLSQRVWAWWAIILHSGLVAVGAAVLTSIWVEIRDPWWMLGAIHLPWMLPLFVLLTDTPRRWHPRHGDGKEGA